eukprot:CAMPEP_0184644956 /NCGR_PEP_ID=MMETSP0308-20130426/1543_1 /TAXON_ID=38269 /ORGANISM="Gloeochaete witrockiana, Strain SAG 46.84" /LENGTH=79 /DNA_ID=CAMNT_0027073715 /DNA_START=458 /DNA_END=697 /DNA_ORIENTATION=+
MALFVKQSAKLAKRKADTLIMEYFARLNARPGTRAQWMWDPDLSEVKIVFETPPQVIPSPPITALGHVSSHEVLVSVPL